MSTLTPQQQQNLLAQIQQIQQGINQAYTAAGLPQPTNQVGGGQPLNAAQLGGASGVGFETPANQAAISSGLQAGSQQGMSSAQTRDVSAGASPAPATMSREQANFALRGAGLGGLVDPGKFAGLSPAEGQRRIQEERQKRLGQTSALTSFAFNPETIAGTKSIVDRINFTLTDVLKNPWESKGTQTDKVKSILEGGSREIAALFNTPEEFQAAMQSNPQLQQTMQSFQSLGGKPEDVQAKIAPPPAVQPQTPDEYLAALSNPNANREAERMAMNELFPESKIAQAEIARQAQIPQGMIDLYFGTEESVGLLKLKAVQAQEEKRILEQRAKDDKIAVENRARLQIEMNNAELREKQAQIEENRLNAKNYMTGILAKLGALQTTGAAPVALQTLETKYQNAAMSLENKYKFANRQIELDMDSTLAALVTKRDENILRIEQDLTKDYETIIKEIMKLEQAAEKEIYRVTEQFSRRLRERTTSYTKDLEKEAAKYAKEFGRIAGGMDLFSLAETVNGSLGRASKKTAITSSITNVKRDIRTNLPANVANTAINDLNDEQLRIFLDDYLNARVSSQQSIDPLPFLEDWKKQYNIKQPKKNEDAEEDEDLF
jgi:hypothetical protein